MKLSSVGFYSLLWSSVSADFLAARSFDHGNNVELGELRDVHDFYSILEQSSSQVGQNGSYEWEDITIFETLDGIEGTSELVDPSSLPGTSLVARQNQCTDLTGITKMVCDNMPSRWWFWGAGGPLIIYYLPKAIGHWLNDVAVAIQAGRNLRRVWRDGSSGPNGLDPHTELKIRDITSHDELKVRDHGIDYHFSLPYMLDSQGKPEASSLSRRSDLGEGIEATLSHDYVYSERDETLYYKGTNGAFSVSDPDAESSSNGRLAARRPTHDYTIVMSVVKRSQANTIARPSCIAQLLKYHIDKSSEKNRFACRPIDNKGSWRATMHLMINHGKRNLGTYGTCCN
ncbi:hypothetical protein BDV38DRAFT_277481 [Aspergillus pseudotamarii]|uniref:Uncharacterized protein n=1 Tax=Aspergillus pseudotamarii TaxID=132259 RepID=A0A5N6TBG4_ASPPS|nr:uncharacterized protein BDV38DRAFT_277481 [Aspergillus pseudotamarii]KAE8143461.1 hypothetical protein BDV38DRAFT_277481 [Aspergillus pseudotamarii]